MKRSRSWPLLVPGAAAPKEIGEIEALLAHMKGER